ncbi:MAG: hypothetical protein ACHREM_25790 [Polyangiales bacterium]
MPVGAKPFQHGGAATDALADPIGVMTAVHVLAVEDADGAEVADDDEATTDDDGADEVDVDDDGADDVDDDEALVAGVDAGFADPPHAVDADSARPNVAAKSGAR